jgi:hypothetical protein
MKELDKIPKENPFRVPENYFEEVQKKIIDRTAESRPYRNTKGKIFSIRPLLAVAASVAFIVTLALVLLFIKPGSREQIAFNGEVNGTEVEYIMQNVDIVTLEDEAAMVWPATGINDVDSEAIIDYLINENISILEIIEHL